jgi:hypothetical protein
MKALPPPCLCPASGAPLLNPIMAWTGVSYEASTIRACLPAGQRPLLHHLVPNRALRDAVHGLLADPWMSSGKELEAFLCPITRTIMEDPVMDAGALLAA